MRLIIKNFGPIKSAELDIRRVNIFIGDTSAGKSTAAKLLAIMNSPEISMIGSEGYELFVDMLRKYDVDYELLNNTYIDYSNGKKYWRITKGKIDTNNLPPDYRALSDSSVIEKLREKTLDSETLENLLKILSNMEDYGSSVYIATERMLMTQLYGSMMALQSDKINMSECIKRFGSLYDKARKENRSYSAPFLNGALFYLNGDNPSFSMGGQNEIMPLRLGSSGVQSSGPLVAVLLSNIEKKRENLFIIEEPEQNLFPKNQVEMINWLAEVFNKYQNKSLVLTTHSPYVLTAVDNLVMGYDANEFIRKNDLPFDVSPLKGEWLIDFQDVSSYYFSSDGVAKDIRNEELRNVGAEHLDSVSENTLAITDSLTDILYCHKK
ncbi:MAG: AAA family ATPase [Bacteroidales bacterium]|nr:AAA family ATPase [Bacteroidales bacterium]